VNLFIIKTGPATMLAALIALVSFTAVAATPALPTPRPYEGEWELASCTPFGPDTKCVGERLNLVIVHSESAGHERICGTFVASNEKSSGTVYKGTLTGAFKNDEPKDNFIGEVLLDLVGAPYAYRAKVSIHEGDMLFAEDGHSGNELKWPTTSGVRLRRVPSTEATARKLVEPRAVCKKWEEEIAKYLRKSE